MGQLTFGPKHPKRFRREPSSLNNGQRKEGGIRLLHYDPRDYGARCGDCPLNNKQPVPPTFNKHATLAIVCEHPGLDEEIHGRPLVGQTGQLFDSVLDRLDIPRAKLHLSNAILCRPSYGTDDKTIKEAITCCRPRLAQELLSIQPTPLVVAGGKRALIALTGRAKIFDWIGAPLKGERFNKAGRKVTIKSAEVDFSAVDILPVLHPAFCLRSPAYTPVFAIHMQRAWAMATKKLPTWEWPETITTDGALLRQALRHIRDKNEPIGNDIETKMSDHSHILNVGVANRDVAVSVTWQEAETMTKVAMLELICSDIPQTGQNLQFDYCSYRKNGIIVPNFDFDTMFAHVVLAPSLKHSLGFQCAVEFPAPRWKDVFRASGDDASRRFEAADPVERAIYNARDSWMTLLLRYRYLERFKNEPHLKKYFDEYMRLLKIAIKMRLRGVGIASENFARHEKNLTEKFNTASTNIKNIATSVGMPDYNPNSHQQVGRFFIEALGVKPVAWSKKTHKPSFDKNALLKITAHPNRAAANAAKAMLDMRRWQKLLKTYIRGMPIVNGLTHPTWNPTGAKTGRWSSKDPNAMNIPKPKWG